jgi:ribosomal protein S18 acetylase RimI-like enzyme
MTYLGAIAGAEPLADLLAAVDSRYFKPHAMTLEYAQRIVSHEGRDVYVSLAEDGRLVSYGMLRGWDEGYEIPSLGVAVRSDALGRGHGRRMMIQLHAIARQREAALIRLRVHPDNAPAKNLYRSLGYHLVAFERGEEVMVVALRPSERT